MKGTVTVGICMRCDLIIYHFRHHPNKLKSVNNLTLVLIFLPCCTETFNPEDVKTL